MDRSLSYQLGAKAVLLPDQLSHMAQVVVIPYGTTLVVECADVWRLLQWLCVCGIVEEASAFKKIKQVSLGRISL
ncbi:hypothetical protein U6M95_12510 [Cutibacterium acnes]